MKASAFSWPYQILVLILALATACQTKPASFIFDFETERDLDALHWSCKTLFSLSDQHVTSGKKSLKMVLYPSPYPGLTLDNFNYNWSEYESLVFDVYNPDNTPLNLTVRIDDRKDPPYSDRANTTFILNPGANHISIPLNGLITSGTGRRLDLSRIEKVILFLVQPTKKQILYLDHLRLE